MMKRAILCLMALALLLGGVGQASAGPITGGPTGLASPQTTITFDGLGLPDFTPITTQFAGSGVTFQNFGYGNNDKGEAGSTGFSNEDLYSGALFGLSGPAVISFTNPVSAAAFAIVDQGDTFTFSAFLGGVGGTLVDTFTTTVPFNPGQGFVGFQGEIFDTIVFTSVNNSVLAIDNLQFNSAAAVPEPASMTMLGIGAASLVGYGLRRRRQAKVAV